MHGAAEDGEARLEGGREGGREGGYLVVDNDVHAPTDLEAWKLREEEGLLVYALP